MQSKHYAYRSAARPSVTAAAFEGAERGKSSFATRPVLCAHGMERAQWKRARACARAINRGATVRSAWGSSMCPFNRKKSVCRWCGSASICLHNCRRAACRDCGGELRRTHASRVQKCKECKGASRCDHNRGQHICKACKDSSIGERNRERRRYEICKPHHKAQEHAGPRAPPAVTDVMSLAFNEYPGSRKRSTYGG
jgi:hypothetical protein